jgi:hypothetical protein
MKKTSKSLWGERYRLVSNIARIPGIVSASDGDLSREVRSRRGDLRPPGAFQAFPQEKSFLLPASRSPHSLRYVNEIFEEHRISFYFPRQNPTRFRFVSGGGFETNRRGRQGTVIAYFFDSLFLPLGPKRRRDPHRSILAKF